MGIVLLIAREIVQKQEYERELNQKDTFIDFQHEKFKQEEDHSEIMTLVAQSAAGLITEGVFYHKESDSIVMIKDLEYLGDL